MGNPIITILNAGPGMGFYIPGIVMHRKLIKQGLTSHVHVIESFYKHAKKEIIPKIKSSFQESFTLAVLAHNLARDPQDALDEQAISQLIDRWSQEKRSHFIVFSGFWLPVLNQYKKQVPYEIHIDCCHLDADYSVSWKMYPQHNNGMTNIWFHNWKNRAINFYLDIDGKEPRSFADRTNNLIIHGGGWGLGDFELKAYKLLDTEFELSVVAYGERDFNKEHQRISFLRLSSDWNIWDSDSEGKHGFPPLYSVDRADNFKEHLMPAYGYSPLYDIVKKSKAIICKPGAGTLIDSLSAATPLIILEPYGKSEDKNGLLWKHYGLGISFDDWAATSFSNDILEKMHQNLLRVRAGATNYFYHFLDKLKETI